MKKILLTFTLVFGFYTANAQLALVRSDFAIAPQKYKYDVDSKYEPADIKTTGSNQVWDFTNLKNESVDITIFHVASETPNYAMFPKADMALQMDSTKPVMYYMLDGNDSVVIIGSTDSTISNIHFRPLIFPLKYNTTWTDKGKNVIQAAGKDLGYDQADSVRITMNYIFVNTADGEGKLKLKSGEVDALKVRTINTIGYKIEIKKFFWIPLTDDSKTDTSYSFYGEKSGFAIVSLESKGNGIYRTRHKEIITNSATVNNGIFQNLRFHVYPNPATNYLNITFKDVSEFKITDMIGREMMAGNLENNTIDISKLTTGNYIIHVLKNKEIVGVQKFIKK